MAAPTPAKALNIITALPVCPKWNTSYTIAIYVKTPSTEPFTSPISLLFTLLWNPIVKMLTSHSPMPQPPEQAAFRATTGTLATAEDRACAMKISCTLILEPSPCDWSSPTVLAVKTPSHNHCKCIQGPLPISNTTPSTQKCSSPCRSATFPASTPNGHGILAMAILRSPKILFTPTTCMAPIPWPSLPTINSDVPIPPPAVWGRNPFRCIGSRMLSHQRIQRGLTTNLDYSLH